MSGPTISATDCTDCDAAWELTIVYPKGKGDCAPYGLDRSRTITRKLGYAASLTVGGTPMSNVVLGYDTDAGSWRAIGQMTFGSPNPMNYQLNAGEPTWEHAH